MSPLELSVQTLMEAVERDDALAERLGLRLAVVLRLRRDAVHADRYQTCWGNKRAGGIARTVLRVVANLELPPAPPAPPSSFLLTRPHPSTPQEPST